MHWYKHFRMSFSALSRIWLWYWHIWIVLIGGGQSNQFKQCMLPVSFPTAIWILSFWAIWGHSSGDGKYHNILALKRWNEDIKNCKIVIGTFYYNWNWKRYATK